MGQTMSANNTQPSPAEAATDVGADDAIDEFDRGFAYVAAVCMAAVATMAALAVLWPAS